MIEGIGGNDVMTRSYGKDEFAFNFAVSESGSATFDDIRQTPTQTSRANTNGVWNSHLDALNGWRAAMEAVYGDTAIMTQTEHYAFGNNRGGSETFDDTYSWGGGVEGEGQDTVTDFGNGNDSLAFKGATLEQSEELFTVVQNEGDTVISWGTSDFIDLQGMTLTKQALLDYIVFA